MRKILTGKEAKYELFKLLRKGRHTYPQPYVAGYYKEINKGGRSIYIAFDNTGGCCWTEEISTEKNAREWCEGKLDTETLHAMEN